MRLVAARWLAVAVALAWSASAVAAPSPTEAKAKSPAEKIRQELDQVVSVDISEQPLTLAVNQLKEQTKINFVLDKLTLTQLGVDPDMMPVTVKMKDVKLRTALRTIFGQFNLSYAVIDDIVFISAPQVVVEKQMQQSVNIDLDDVEFDAAMRRLGRETATNIVLDPRCAKEAKAKLTMHVDEAGLEGTVKLMCVMVDLRAVRIGNTLFVCSKKVAEELQKDPAFNPNPIPRGPDGTPIPTPGVPGVPGLPGGLPAVPGMGGFGNGGGLQILPLNVPGGNPHVKELRELTLTR